MNKHFPVLSLVSFIIRLLGALSVVAGVYFALYEGAIEPNLANHRFSTQDMQQLVSGLGGIVSGLLMVAAGEIIGVLFAIEANTRKSALPNI